MSGRVPTPEQSLAIETDGHDVLVEAGAGTGKTGVMVDRYCRLVCDLEVSPDAVLAFTFTDKAATELRQRIRAALELRSAEGSRRALELLATIGGAWVTTIHGFCNRLLAGHPVAAGVDPRYRVLDGPEAERAAREAFDDALAEFLAGGEEARERTVAAFEIGGLRAIVSGVHAELRSRGAAAPSLPEPPPSDPAAAVRHATEAARETIEELKPTNSSRELVERALVVLRAGGPPSLDQLAALRTDSRAKSMSAYREAIDAAVASTAETGEGGDAYRHIAELLGLFSRRYAAVKERREGLDFEDLQLRAVQLLEREEIGNAYRARFSHLLVDEFQDTNRLQLRLIEALRGPRTALMVVGDELQSIYGFRHADLDVFRERRRAVERGEGGVAMDLSGNFRSRPEVIGAVNAIGEKLLGDVFHPLRVGAPPRLPHPRGDERPAVELLLTCRDGWDAEGIDLAPATDADTPPNHLAEARFVAERLRELAEGGVERGEMVVLLRAFTHLDAYEDSLERAGLHPYTIGGRGYWSQQQVADVCSLLATIANPLDDQAVFGALASPACGAAPDTLWLLRAAAGRRRHVWPAVEQAAGLDDAELEDPQRLEAIPEPELALLRRFARSIERLRARAGRLPLAGLIDAAIAETGYDLAVLMRPAGEARFANVRKLMRLAGEFEDREGRDLRGLLDFLASRAEADTDAEAASAIEGHDGVRIMTIHSAKGLEFGVVAVPSLSRRLLAGSRSPALTLGHESEGTRIGLQLRRLGAASINLYSHEQLCAETQQRDAAEELRLFHVAATRARERLILSGVAMPQPGRGTQPGTPVIERILDGFEVDREHDSTIAVPAPRPRQGLDAGFEPSRIAVRVNPPSPERAAELTTRRSEDKPPAPLGEGRAPLLERQPPTVPNRPLSYTAIAAYEECAYRFYMERVLDLGGDGRHFSRTAEDTKTGAGGGEPENLEPSREEGAARGAVVHALLEWSQANEWREPGMDLLRRHATTAGLDPEGGVGDELLAAVRAWLGSGLLRERALAPGAASRAEVPLLLRISGAMLRGSIDLLIERDGDPPLVVDYKTDRLGGSAPAERAATYGTQRAIYALAVSEARRAAEVEVAYVFLERPEKPVVELLGPEAMERGRDELAATIARIAAGEFPVAPVERRSWELCSGCPALGRLCSGPASES